MIIGTASTFAIAPASKESERRSMSKEIKFSSDARAAMVRGVDIPREGDLGT